MKERAARGLRFVAVTLALGCAPALLVVVLLLRFVGEDWWVTTVALYLPRVGFALPLVGASLLLLLVGRRRWLWTQVPALGLLVFPLMGFEVSRPWHSSGRRTLRVMSYNINSFAAGADAIVRDVLAQSADIVFLQEFVDAGPVVDRLRLSYPFVEAANNVLVAARFPVQVTVPPKFLRRGEEHNPRYTRQLIQTPLGPIAFYNIHPVSPRLALAAVRGHGVRRELWSGRLFSGTASPVVIDNAELRRMELETAARAAALETVPVVLAGDTNLPWLSAIFARNFGRYQDGFAKVGFGFGYTFPSKWPWMRIDRVLASDELEFVSFETRCGTASDHRCVVAEIARR